MRIRLASAAVALALVLVAATACSNAPHSAHENVARVAAELNVSVPAPPVVEWPVVPIKPAPMDLYAFMNQAQQAFGGQWYEMLYQHSGSALPAKLMLLTRAKGDSPATFTTQCPELNDGNSLVRPETQRIFFCPLDSAGAQTSPGTAAGVLWLPVDALVALWNHAQPIANSGVQPEQQIWEAMFAVFIAVWGKGIANAIFDFAARHLSVQLPAINTQYTRQVAYCTAGVVSWQVFGPKSAARSMREIVQNDGTGPITTDDESAFHFGFMQRTLGKCIGQYWPHA